MSDVAAKVKEIIMDKLGTSEETVELMMELEEAFGVEIEDEEAEKIQTVKDAITYIEQKMAG